MSEQNSYRKTVNYKTRETEEWEGWRDTDWLKPADDWQDAIHDWLSRAWPTGDYTVVAETPSGDGRSGIIEIQFGPKNFWAGVKIQATPLED